MSQNNQENPESEIATTLDHIVPSIPSIASAGVIVLGSAVLGALLAAFLLVAFMLFRARRRRLAGKRGKSGLGTQHAQVDADVLLDRGRWRRPRLPWPLSIAEYRTHQDSQRGFYLLGFYVGGWGHADDSLSDPTGSHGGRISAAGGTGPRFLATTASGKALQVVVKTAQLQQYTSSSQHLHGGGEHEGGGGGGTRQVVWGFPQGPSTGLAATPATLSRLGSRVSYMGSNPGLGGYDGPPGPARAAAPSGGELERPLPPRPPHEQAQLAAGAGHAEPRATASDEAVGGGRGGNGGAAVGGGGVSEGGTAGPRAPLQRLLSDGRGGGGSTDSFGSEEGAGSGLPGGDGDGGGAAGGQGTGAVGRSADLDPAAAWYSRALHRQVADRLATAAQAAAGVPKAHQA